MKNYHTLIIITILLIVIQGKIYPQNSEIIKPLNNPKDTLYDIERMYKPPKNGINANTNLDSLEFTERRIPKVRKIFKAGRIYHYRAIYLASNNDTLSNSLVNMKTTGERWEWQPEKQDLIYYEFPDYKADSIKLCNHYINKEFQFWAGKTEEGVIENVKQVWMHPVRVNQYKFTEVAPFPEVNLPLKKGKKWSEPLMIGDGWGEWNGQNIENNYKITGHKKFLLQNIKIDCWIIKSVSKSSFGKSKLTTFFNEEYGFVKLLYKNYEKEKLIFELIKVEEK